MRRPHLSIFFVAGLLGCDLIDLKPLVPYQDDTGGPSGLDDGGASDGGSGDGGVDGGAGDGGTEDGGTEDGGADGGTEDGGTEDGGTEDGGTEDGGSGDGGGPVDADSDGFDSDVDCNDDDPAINPDAFEHCDGVDNDCDDAIDEAQTWDFDAMAGSGLLTLNGDAWLDGSTLVLTDAAETTSTAWLDWPVAGDTWAMRFEAEVISGSDPAADGLAFAWQFELDSSVVAGGGGGHGVKGIAGHAVELDAYPNAKEGDLDGEHLAIVDTLDFVPLQQTLSSFVDAGTVEVEVLHFDGTVWVSIDGVETLVATPETTAELVMFGFGGASGALWSVQRILAAETSCPTAGGTLEPPTCPDEDLGPVEGDGVASGSTHGATDDFEGACGGGGGPDTSLGWQAPAHGCYVLDTSDSTFDTVLSVYESCDGSELTCDDEGGDAGTSQLQLGAREGESYLFVVDALDAGESGAWSLDVNATTVSVTTDGDLGSATGDGVASGTIDPPLDRTLDSTCGDSSGVDEVYLWEAPSTGTFVFDTEDSTFDTVLSLHDAWGCVEELACDDDGGGGLTSSLAADLEAGEVVYVRVAGYSIKEQGGYTLDINEL